MSAEQLLSIANLGATSALIFAFLYTVVRCRVSVNCGSDEEDQ